MAVESTSVRRDTHKASRHHASRPTWAGSGRRLAMDCVRKEKRCLRRCHGITHKQHITTHSVSIPCPLPSTDTKNTRKMGSRNQLCGNLTILADSHRPERHAHCRVRDNGVPVLQVEPIRARLRQLRVVVQELEQDDDEVVTPRPDPRHCGHEQNKSANLGKRDA